MTVILVPCLKLSNGNLFALGIKYLTWFRKFPVIKHLLSLLSYPVLWPSFSSSSNMDLFRSQHARLVDLHWLFLSPNTHLSNNDIITRFSSSSLQFQYHILTIPSRVASRSCAVVNLFHIAAKHLVSSDHLSFIYMLTVLKVIWEQRQGMSCSPACSQCPQALNTYLLNECILTECII